MPDITTRDWTDESLAYTCTVLGQKGPTYTDANAFVNANLHRLRHPSIDKKPGDILCFTSATDTGEVHLYVGGGLMLGWDHGRPTLLQFNGYQATAAPGLVYVGLLRGWTE